MRTTLLLVAVLVSATACNKHKAKCEKYTGWAMKCDKDKSLEASEKDQLETMLTGMCVAAFDGEFAGASAEEKKIMVEMYDHIKSVATCADKATTCDEYAKCEATAKKQ